MLHKLPIKIVMSEESRRRLLALQQELGRHLHGGESYITETDTIHALRALEHLTGVTNEGSTVLQGFHKDIAHPYLRLLLEGIGVVVVKTRSHRRIFPIRSAAAAVVAAAELGGESIAAAEGENKVKAYFAAAMAEIIDQAKAQGIEPEETIKATLARRKKEAEVGGRGGI